LTANIQTATLARTIKRLETAACRTPYRRGGNGLCHRTFPDCLWWGDSGGALAPVDAPQCSGSSCGTQGQPPSQPINGALCPADADIVKSTYLGGAGSGEVVSVNIDAVAMTYTLKWLESPIPLATGTVTPSRAGVTITGKVVHPPTGTLPTAEQTRCAFVLTPGAAPPRTARPTRRPPTSTRRTRRCCWSAWASRAAASPVRRSSTTGSRSSPV
jgi:hypothetical protein